MAVTADSFGAIRAEIEDIAGDGSAEPDDKVARLRHLAEEAKGIVGLAQRHLADAENLREARASGAAHRVLRAREDADVRREALRRGLASEDELDARGYLSHDELDHLDEEGLLEQRLAELDGTPPPSVAGDPEEEGTEAVPATDVAAVGGGDPEQQLAAAGTLTAATLRAYARAATGGQTTADLYSDGEGTWDASRRDLHRQIIDAFFREPSFSAEAAGGDGAWVPDPAGAALTPGGRREAVFAAGGPASGKNTLLAYLRAEGTAPEGAVMLSLDGVLELIPEGRGSGRAGAYEEAAAIADEVFQRALERGFNATVDGLFAESAASVARRVRALALEGYEVRVLYVDVPTEEALRRMAARAERQGRMMPELVARMGHRDSAATIVGLARMLAEDAAPGVTLEVWDNAQGEDAAGVPRPPRRVYSLQQGQEMVEDPAVWRRVQEKAHERLMGGDAA